MDEGMFARILIAVLFLIGILVGISIYETKINNYCKENGWEGAVLLGNDDFQCYKYVESPTGLGYDKILSGKILR